MANTLEFLSKQDILPLSDVDDGLLIHILSEQQSLELEIAQLRAKAAKLKADLEAVWRDSRNAEYELSSVFIHRGTSPSWGHYFFYSRHLPEAPNSWFKYNDSDVSLVAKEEVIADGTGSTANPYLVSGHSTYPCPAMAHPLIVVGLHTQEFERDSNSPQAAERDRRSCAQCTHQRRDLNSVLSVQPIVLVVVLVTL